MKFVLEVDVPVGDVVTELGAILRGVAGNLQHYPLAPGNGAPVHDESHNEVGHWHMIGGRAAEEVEDAFDDFEAYEAGDEEVVEVGEAGEAAYDTWR
jgi:hypothetical protein